MSRITLEVKNFLGLRNFSWSPDGVSLLVGVNDANAALPFAVMNFLIDFFRSGHTYAFWNMPALPPPDPSEPSVLTATVGDLTWKIWFPPDNCFPEYGRPSEPNYAYEERLHHDGRCVFFRKMSGGTWNLNGADLPLPSASCLRELRACGNPPWLRPMVNALPSYTPFSWHLDRIQQDQPSTGQGVKLHISGKNLWSVLSNWERPESSPEKTEQYRWVTSAMCRAFPGAFGRMWFDRRMTDVQGRPFVLPPGATYPGCELPPRSVDSGVLLGLAHLTAVAEAPRGSVLALNELDRQLSPHALRSILHDIRERADTLGLVVLLASRSPTLMNAFQEHPENLYVLRQDRPDHPLYSTQPKALPELIGTDMLAQTTPGELYDWGELSADHPPV